MPSYSEFRTFRFIILFCGCMLTFGSFFSFDMPSTIQTELQDSPVDCDENGTFLDIDNATSEYNVTCCTGCLGLGPLHYNLLFALYAWTASINVLIAGVVVDRLGTKFAAVLYGSLSLSGSLIFALSIVKGLRNTAYMFPMLMIGRFLLGSGNSGMRIVQDRVTAFWFRHKELSLAFGICLTFSRLGSVFNFLFTSVVVKKYGLEVLFWASSVLCCSGFLFVVLMTFLDQYGLKKLNKTDKEQERNLECKDIRDFSATYWILTIVTMLSYSTIIPYIADSSKFYQDKYGYNQHIASYIAGAPYYIALLGAPILGIIVDNIGFRGYFMILSAAITLPVLPLTAFTSIPAYIVSPLMGFNYILAAITMWPSVPLLVKPRALGIAMGILTSFQFIGIGIANLVMGKLLNLHGPEENKSEDWITVLMFLMSIIILCLIFSILLNVVDWKQDNILNKKSIRCLTESNCSSYYSGSESGSQFDVHSAINQDLRSRIAPNYQALISSASSFNSQSSLKDRLDEAHVNY